MHQSHNVAMTAKHHALSMFVQQITKLLICSNRVLHHESGVFVIPTVETYKEGSAPAWGAYINQHMCSHHTDTASATHFLNDGPGMLGSLLPFLIPGNHTILVTGQRQATGQLRNKHHLTEVNDERNKSKLERELSQLRNVSYPLLRCVLHG